MRDGTRLKKLRVQRGLSQRELAESISIDRSMISLYENDHREIPTSTAKLIANYFNVSVDYLLGIDTARNSDTQKAESERTVSQSILICLIVLVKQNCNSFPQKSSRAFLPRSKTVIERMRSDGIIPKQNIIINIRKQFAF